MLSNCIPSRNGSGLRRGFCNELGVRTRREKFSEVTSYYGQQAELDSQGRLTIAEWLRNKFGLKGEMAVIGKLKHIEIRLKDEFRKTVEDNPLDQRRTE